MKKAVSVYVLLLFLNINTKAGGELIRGERDTICAYHMLKTNLDSAFLANSYKQTVIPNQLWVISGNSGEGNGVFIKYGDGKKYLAVIAREDTFRVDSVAMDTAYLEYISSKKHPDLVIIYFVDIWNLDGNSILTWLAVVDYEKGNVIFRKNIAEGDNKFSYPNNPEDIPDATQDSTQTGVDSTQAEVDSNQPEVIPTYYQPMFEDQAVFKYGEIDIITAREDTWGYERRSKYYKLKGSCFMNDKEHLIEFLDHDENH